MRRAGLLRPAIQLQLLGLLLEALSLLRLRPLTFTLFVGLALPLLIAGVVLYLAHVLGQLRGGPIPAIPEPAASSPASESGPGSSLPG